MLHNSAVLGIYNGKGTASLTVSPRLQRRSETFVLFCFRNRSSVYIPDWPCHLPAYNPTHIRWDYMCAVSCTAFLYFPVSLIIFLFFVSNSTSFPLSSLNPTPTISVESFGCHQDHLDCGSKVELVICPHTHGGGHCSVGLWQKSGLVYRAT